MASVRVLLPGEADSGGSIIRADDTNSTSSRKKDEDTANTMPRTRNADDQFVDMSALPVPADDKACTEVADDTSASRQNLAAETDDKMRRSAHGTNLQKSECVVETYENGHGVGVDSNCYHDKTILSDANSNETITKTKKASPSGVREVLKTVARVVACFLCGVVFGVAAEKGRVFETATIRGQFIYEKFIMMKMFLSAGASGLFCLSVLSIIPATRKYVEGARTAYVSCLAQKGFTSAIIGGSLLGIGMVISGSCPGMVLVQIGAWLSNGGGAMTFLGCIVAVFVYAFLEPWITRLLSPAKPYEKYLADNFVDKWKIPYAAIALAFAIFMGLIVLAIELLKPWTTELANPNKGGSWFFESLAWPPYLSGALIGSLQIPLVLLVGDTLGSSSSYCTIASQVLVTKQMETWLPYLARFKRGLENWWQVLFVAGAVLGACISAAASQSLGSTSGVSLIASFFGGFFLLFGSRLAGGCTSGHGLSGMGVLSVLSFAAVAAMFTGGTAFGFIFWAVSNASTLDYYTF